MREQLASLVASASDSNDNLLALYGELETAKAAVWLKLAVPSPIQAPDHLLSIDEAARRLGSSIDYLYRHKDNYPFTRRNGRAVRFSSNGIDAYIRSGSKAVNKALTAKQHKRTIGLAV
jgi:predicted DNA-binding transcriptional regulator AlpA